MELLTRLDLRQFLLCLLLGLTRLAFAAGPEDNFPPGGQLPLSWATSPGANAGWVVASESANGGALSLRSSAIPDDPTSAVRKSAAIEVAGTWIAGTVTFAYQVSSELGFDFLEFYVDGNKLLSASGTVGWTLASYPVSAGAHVFKWVYAKDESNAAGSDAAWIDSVVLPAGTLMQLLSVSRTGTGLGTITSDVGGIVCGVKCAVDLSSNLPVTLTAATGPGSRFVGWTGSCSGANPICPLVMGAPKAATANFAPADDNFPAGGSVPAGWTTAPGASAGWSVATDSTQAGTYSLKSAAIGDGQVSAVQFTATVAAGAVEFAYKVSSEAFYDEFTFSIDNVQQVKRSGDLDWTRMSVPVTAGTHVFKFAYQKDTTTGGGSNAAWIDSVTLPGVSTQWLTILGAGIGAGAVSSSTGINCGTTCALPFAIGTPVVLSAIPAVGSRFSNWTGACSGTNPTCVVTMDGTRTTTAMFWIPGIGGPLDIDGSAPSSVYDALTDGLLTLRYLFGQTGPTLTAGALGPTATRTDPVAIKDYLDKNRNVFDIDGDGTVDALSDGLMILRYLFGLRGSLLISGTISPKATRTTAAAVEGYIQSLMP